MEAEAGRVAEERIQLVDRVRKRSSFSIRLHLRFLFLDRNSFASRLAPSYSRHFAFYLARPARSIVPFFILPTFDLLQAF
jgi:hypothetical protein